MYLICTYKSEFRPFSHHCTGKYLAWY